jgi:hypothetical protein
MFRILLESILSGFDHYLEILHFLIFSAARRNVVVKALSYKPEGRGFDTR